MSTAEIERPTHVELTERQLGALVRLADDQPDRTVGEIRASLGLQADEPWLAYLDRLADQHDEKVLDLLAVRPPEFSEYDKPDHLEPLVGFHAEDWDGASLERVVEPASEDGPARVVLAIRTRSGQTIEPWPRDLVRVDPLIEQANGQHRRHEHDTGAHPFCELCELRLQRSTYLNNDVDNLAKSDETLLAEARPTIEARVLGLLVRDNGRVPTFSPRVPIEEGDVWASLRDLLDQDPPGFLFDGVIPERGLGYLTGRDGTFKTFLALDLAMHLATDRESWHGRDVSDWGAEVVFVAGEGAHSFGKRIKAWLTEHDERLTDELAGRLHIRSGSVNLYTGGPAYDELLELCQERQPSLVVIDTLQTNSTGAESNSASDMGEVTARLHRLKEASGGAVLVLAHTGKSDQDARGSSSIEDDADYVLHVKRDDLDLALKVTKQKDGDSGFTVPLKAVPAHDSVIIRANQPEQEWASDNLANRIRGVLYAVRTGDEPTAPGVLAMVRDDGTGRPASRTQVYEVLGDLEREGVVIGTKDGAKAKTYRLDLSKYPQEAR